MSKTRRRMRGGAFARGALAALLFLFISFAQASPLDPRGRVHLPIGIPNTVDALKTFVEAEGNFSPGFASYGIYFWLWDAPAGRLIAPTMDGVQMRHTLPENGALRPQTLWRAGHLVVQTELCQVERNVSGKKASVVGARVVLSNAERVSRQVSLFVAVRPLGAAGGPVKSLEVSGDGAALLVDGRPAVVAQERPAGAGVSAADVIGEFVLRGQLPADQSAVSAEGNCSGALRFDLAVGPGQVRAFEFVCPVLPGRYAGGHKWDGKSEWAQLDTAVPNDPENGELQPAPPLRYFSRIKTGDLFAEAERFWAAQRGLVRLDLPDARWSQGFHVMTAHAALTMNEDAPDVAVANYNVFNRDGVYIANILQKSGNFVLAEKAIDYFLRRPFNGRIYPEADNPGQVLWIAGEHWLFTRDRKWLDRVYPSVQKLARMIAYYRATPGPHWVSASELAFGDDVPAEQRQELKPGRCDGFHPEYAEAFDIAGLSRAAMLAEMAGNVSDAIAWHELASDLATVYDSKFGRSLTNGYGSYAVLWPCRLYPLGKAEQFASIGAQEPGGWSYFPLARAHQGLLAGNRSAGFGTLNAHFDREQMRGWFLLDEGGESGVGAWNHARTRWKQGTNSVAMPHGWAIAEMQLLLRDSLLFEDASRLILFGGVPKEWFAREGKMAMENLPTHFGRVSVHYTQRKGRGELRVEGGVPPSGCVLRLPADLAVKEVLLSSGKPAEQAAPGDYILPKGAARLEIVFPEQ